MCLMTVCNCAANKLAMHEEPQKSSTKPQQNVWQLWIDTKSKNYEGFPLLLSDCFIRVVYITCMAGFLEYMVYECI